MLTNILFALWFFLPAGLSNTTPVIVAKIPFLKNYNYPIDFKKSFRGKRIFGDHKTIRGFITGMIVAVIVSMLEVNIYSNNEFVRSVVRIDYSQINPLILYLLEIFKILSMFSFDKSGESFTRIGFFIFNFLVSLRSFS